MISLLVAAVPVVLMLAYWVGRLLVADLDRSEREIHSREAYERSLGSDDRTTEEQALAVVRERYAHDEIDVPELERQIEAVLRGRPAEERALPPRDEEWEAEAAARERVTNFHQVFDPPTLPVTGGIGMISAMVEPFRSGPSSPPVPIATWSSTGSSAAYLNRRSPRARLRSLGVVFPEDNKPC